MITPMQMYWLLKLDDIGAFCIFAIFACIALLFIPVMAYCNVNDDLNEKEKKGARILFCLAVIGGVFFGAVKTLLPSTKQMAAIYVVPAITNNEKIQQIGGKTLDITNQLLDLTKDYLSEKAAADK